MLNYYVYYVCYVYYVSNMLKIQHKNLNKDSF